MSDNYTEETRPLFKLLRTEAFRFVIVRFNHYSFLRQLESDLQSRFPDRPFLKADAAASDYRSILDAYFSINRGFFFLENFDDVLKEDRDSLQRETPQMAANNERRRQITAGLNLRRDKLAQSPIALFVFVPATTGELYAKTIMEKMPDLWSFRSLMLDLEKEVATAVSDITPEKYIPKAEIVNTDDTELRRLISLLDNTPETELAYRLTLYPQIVNAANDLGKYDLAFSTLDTWEQHVQDNEKPWIWIQKGDILNVFGKLEDALPLFEKAIEQASLSDDKNDVGLGHERLGYLYLLRGDLNNALLHFEKYKEIELELSTKTPSISMFKNNLAISYEKLGSTHTALGNLQQALKFFEDETQLFEELFKDYPNNVAFKNGLAISYERLGSTHTALGNLQQALKFFEDEQKLKEELYNDYPNNVNFKNGLAISYSKLGDTHTALGNLQQALKFFEDNNKLAQELFKDYPNNVAFKNGLAISYYKLGELYEKLEDLEKAFFYFEKGLEMTELTFQSSPDNAQFKKNLKISYNKMGDICQKMGKNELAEGYFEKARGLGG